jgi:hypothetical protein
MLQLSPRQIQILERVISRGFAIVEFPLYASSVGVRKENCAALLVPVGQEGFRFFSEPSYLVDGKLSVKVQKGSRAWFVWKKTQIEATPERAAELAEFRAELDEALTAII